MKLIKTSLLALGLLCVSLQSCNYTDLEPTDKVGIDKAFKDVPSVTRVMIGTYSVMSLRESLQIAEYIADDVVQGSDAGGSGTDEFGWVYGDGGASNAVWSRQYKVINNANRILHQSGEVVPNGAAEEEAMNNNFGQAYFLRAYAHFELLRFFTDFKNDETLGVPYVSYPHVLGLPSRDKVAYCYDYLMKDLEKAFNLIPASRSDVAYATRASVQALRARIALYHQQYVHAYVYATEALRMVPMESAQDFPAIWTDKSKKGVIMELPRAQGESYIGTLFVGGDNSSVFRPSAKYMACYEANDARKSAYIGKGPDRGGSIVDRVQKYIGTAENIGLNDEKIFRSAEMKLIEIESLIHQDRLADANLVLNSFRALRISGWVAKQFTKEQLISELLLERRRELSYEGHRFFDLRRYNLPIVRDNGATLAADHFRMIMPIPKSEMDANKNMEQNEGYKR